MDLKEYNSTQLLAELNNGTLSVLEELGAYELRREMIPAGRFCKYLADYICLKRDDNKLRARAVKVLRIITPCTLIGEFQTHDDAIVIGFNHPSLGEIFRLLYLAFIKYPDREFLFPVNIPWYEVMTPLIPKLARLKINITPMITPSTEKKLKAKFSGDEKKLSDVQHIKTMLERKYMKTAKDMAEHNQVIIFVAPSATRQAAVIGEHIHPTMTILAHMLCKNDKSNVHFVPTTVVEPVKNDRKMNLFKEYKIVPCKAFSADEVRNISNHSREFDLEFLKRIDEVYSQYRN